MSTTALVITRNVALAMGLELQQIAVVHSRPDDALPEPSDDLDVVVLDLGDPQASLEALQRLRSGQHLQPVLVLGTDRFDWSALVAGDASTAMGAMPLSASAIADAANRLIAAHKPRAVDAEPEVDATSEASDDRPPDALALAPVAEVPTSAPPATHRRPGRLRAAFQNSAARRPTAEPQTAVLPPDAAIASPELPPEPVAWADAPAEPPIDEPVQPHAAPSGAPVPPPPLLPAPPPPPPPVPPPLVAPPPAPPIPPQQRPQVMAHGRASSVDQQLNQAVSDAIRVPAAATPLADVIAAILAEAVETMGAAAAAMLIRVAADVWRVEAGIALRPNQIGLELSADHWLVQQTIRHQLAVVIEDSDLLRGRLIGVPLASWRYLAAAPIGGDQAILVLAAGDRPFDEVVVRRLAALGKEASPLLAEAMMLRQVAHSLQRFL